jgi:hypothetical protein
MFLVLVYLIVIVLAWLISRPLAVVLTIVALGNLRKVVIANSLAWEAPRYAAVFGYVVGGVIAVVVRVISRLAVASLWARLAYAAFGLMPILYVGYGVPRDLSSQNLADSYRLVAEGSGVVSYLVISAAIIGVMFFIQR